MLLDVPLRPLTPVAVMVWIPTVSSVALKDPTPAARLIWTGRVAWPSVDVIVRGPVKFVATLPCK